MGTSKGGDEEAGRAEHDRAFTNLPLMQIVYRGLTYTVQVKQKKRGLVPRDLLKAVSGVIEPSRSTAVMGASGAGKTTLLNVLAGYAKSGATVSGSITVNGSSVTADKMRQISGYVHQEDVLLGTMTVREALLFSAMLRLPSSMSTSTKTQRALDVADLLNLNKALDSVVGSAMVKGISGGEKRRLSFGCEMVTNPAILFLDEPTSGLDSYTAYKVCRILKTITQRYHRTVVCTIHQPSSDIFHMFDDLVVLAEGRVLYHGPTEEMVAWFGALGFPCPHYTNPADYLFMAILNVEAVAGDASMYDFVGGSNTDAAQAGPGRTEGVGADYSSKEVDSSDSAGQSSAGNARLQELLQAWATSPQDERLQRQMADGSSLLLSTGISDKAIQHSAPFWLQALLLGRRAFRNSWRNPLIAKGKLAQTIFLSLVVGLIYLRVSDDLSGVQDRTGSLFFLVVQGLFGSVMGILTAFGSEKPVFQREFGSRLYGLPAFFLSRWAVELPNYIVMPVLSSLIVYWMVGYQNKADRFGWFALIMVLMDNCGASLGIFVSCLFNDLAVALSVMPMFLLPLMVFSGFFVNSNTIPPYFNWIQYISPMRYGFIALAKNEFGGLQIHCTPDDDCAPNYNGDKAIENLGFDNKGSVQQNAGILFAMMWALLLLAYVALWNAVRRLDK